MAATRYAATLGSYTTPWDTIANAKPRWEISPDKVSKLTKPEEREILDCANSKMTYKFNDIIGKYTSEHDGLGEFEYTKDDQGSHVTLHPESANTFVQSARAMSEKFGLTTVGLSASMNSNAEPAQVLRINLKDAH
jgi:hypothetical protein